jgi:hypothetical protein
VVILAKNKRILCKARKVIEATFCSPPTEPVSKTPLQSGCYNSICENKKFLFFPKSATVISRFLLSPEESIKLSSPFPHDSASFSGGKIAKSSLSI